MDNSNNTLKNKKLTNSDLSNYLTPFLVNIKETDTDKNFDINTFLNNDIQNNKNNL